MRNKRENQKCVLKVIEDMKKELMRDYVDADYEYKRNKKTNDVKPSDMLVHSMWYNRGKMDYTTKYVDYLNKIRVNYEEEKPINETESI